MTDCALPADLFDLHGYLVVPGVLSQELVAQLNAAIDAHADSISIRTDEQTLDGSDSIIHGNKAASGFVGTHGRGDFGGFLWDWGEPAGAMFRELIANENALRVLIGVRASRPRTHQPGCVLLTRRSLRRLSGTPSASRARRASRRARALRASSCMAVRTHPTSRPFRPRWRPCAVKGFCATGANPDNMFSTMRERDFHRWEATPDGGRMRNGLVRVGYQLTDAASEDDGGFCCIPSAALFCQSSPRSFPD